jgi:DNA invertase Pin-like site-specific DNA recombinase
VGRGDGCSADTVTVHILAAVAEHEAKMIWERAKAALAAAKRRDIKFGGYRGTTMTKAMRKAASEVITKRAKARAADPGTDDRRPTGSRRCVITGNRGGPQ